MFHTTRKPKSLTKLADIASQRSLPGDHCSGSNSNGFELSMANETEINNSGWQAMLASFTKA